jgi:hypothetical protein
MAGEEELPLRTRAKDVEIDMLLTEGERLADQLRATIARIRRSVQAHQEEEAGKPHEHG